jgi:hypothetical protein
MGTLSDNAVRLRCVARAGQGLVRPINMLHFPARTEDVAGPEVKMSRLQKSPQGKP